MAYRRESVNAPVVSGLPLRLFTPFVEQGISGEGDLVQAAVDVLRPTVDGFSTASLNAVNPLDTRSSSHDPARSSRH